MRSDPNSRRVSRCMRRAPAGLIAILLTGVLAVAFAVPRRTIAGRITSEDSPVPGAIVRLQGTLHVTRSAADGAFTLDIPASAHEPVITAWSPGHFIGHAKPDDLDAPIAIALTRHFETDNPRYGWFTHEGGRGSRSCGHCMPTHFAEWQADAHSRSATNPRFLTVYRGTDLEGNQSPLTRYSDDPDYRQRPRPPDLARPYFGPGYKLDFPDTAGNCGACHIPVAAVGPEGVYGVDPDNLTDLEKEGASCEFCHKIGAVSLDPATRLPYPDRPGVLSIRLYRPEDDQELFFGTFDDVTRRVSYLPLQSESAFCAPCHYGVFWETVVYNSYGEWLHSPYSDPESGKTCQECHMPATEATRFVPASRGGIARPPGRIFNHTMPGASDEKLLQDTAKLELAGARRASTIIAAAKVTNENGGHHIPTDHPSRQIILLVEARDSAGDPLQHTGNHLLPWWTGQGDEPDDYAGRPGRAFARILEESWTGIWPTIAYWNPTTEREDTRIPAFGADLSRYEFLAPNAGAVTVEARLLFRRAFKHLARQKKWTDEDILMERETIHIP